MAIDLCTVQDPRSQYPGPPKDVEIQPAPATTQAMSQKPDCGEESYKGSGKLAGRKAVLLPGDVSHEGFCQRLVHDAVEQLGGLDILVNNAGRMGKTEGLLDTTTERFDLLMKTNIYSIFWITKAALPHLKPGASIINTTSIQGFEPSANIFDYAITKAAIANFTKGLSSPLMEQYGVRINAVAPGPIWTPLQEADGSEKKLKSLGEKTPYKRPGQPVELAPVYVLLASQEGSYVTGEIYGVTGGMGGVKPCLV